MQAMRSFTAQQYGQAHRVAADPTLAVCGRPIPVDAEYQTVVEPPQGECARCWNLKLPDYTLSPGHLGDTGTGSDLPPVGLAARPGTIPTNERRD